MSGDQCDYKPENGRCQECHGFTWGLPYGHSCACDPAPTDKAQALAEDTYPEGWQTKAGFMPDPIHEERREAFLSGFRARDEEVAALREALRVVMEGYEAEPGTEFDWPAWYQQAKAAFEKESKG